MSDYTLKNVDSEDIEDVLKVVEQSYQIKFTTNELAHVTTFGDLCDYISDKIDGENVSDCTTQQVFYKLRNAIILLELPNNESVTPKTRLVDILPRKNRRVNVKKIQKQLGFKPIIMEPNYTVIVCSLVIFLLSFVKLFYSWRLGLFGLALAMLGFRISKIVGKKFSVQTVGELAEKITRENYIHSRRDGLTVNRSEIEDTLRALFADLLAMDESLIKRDSCLN